MDAFFIHKDKKKSKYVNQPESFRIRSYNSILKNKVIHYLSRNQN